MTTPTATEVLTALLDVRTWVAHDIDDQGRILAGSDELGTLQLVEIDPAGERTPLTALPGRCHGRYIPGRRAVLVQHDNAGDEKWQISLLDLATRRDEPAGLEDLVPIVHDPAHLNVLQDVTPTTMVYSTNRRNEVDMDVVVRNLDSGVERVVHDQGGYAAQTVVAHNRAAVAVTSLSLLPASTVVSLVSGAAQTAITDPNEHALHLLAGWTPDDCGLVLASNHDREFAAVFEVTTDGRHWQPLVAADDHDLLATLSADGTALLVAHHVDGLDTLAIHEADGTPRVDVQLPPSCLQEAHWSPDASRVVLTVASPTDPGSIVVVDAASGGVTSVVDARDGIPGWLRERLVEPSVHRVPASDGEQIPCFRYAAAPATPADDPATPTNDPVAVAGASVLHIHGGPASEARRLFSPIIQALAVSGIDVLVPNVRGSAGYGKRWVSLDDVDLRLDSVADLAAIHAWLPKLGLDPARSALWGVSYGGYMVLAGVSMQPHLWAAGVDIVGMSSLVTFLENTSAYRRAYRECEYGRLDRDRAFLEQASPITHLDAVVAPLFVIHGANDPRVPLSEAEQIKAALDERGIDCVLRVYPDEGHGLSKRANRLDAYPQAIDFLQTHLRAH